MRFRRSPAMVMIALWTIFSSIDLSAIANEEESSRIAIQEGTRKAADELRSMFFNRDFEGGSIRGKRSVAEFPQDLELRAWFILNMSRNDMEEEAAAKAEEMIDVSADSGWSWFALAGALHWIQGRKEEALEASEKALSLRPNDPDFIWMRAETLMRKDKHDEAIKFIDQYSDKMKNPAELLATKGNALFSLSSRTGDQAKFEEALRVFEEARSIDPSNVNAIHIPGTYLSLFRRHDEAYPLMKRALTLAPHSTSVHQSFWRAVLGLKEKSREEKLKEIEDDIESFLHDRGDFPESLHAVVNIYREMDLNEKRESIEEKILRDFPESRAAEWMLVNRYRDFEKELGQDSSKDPERINQYRRLLKDFINRPHHHHEGFLGDAYRNLFYSIKDDASVSPDELLKVVQGMVKYEKINPHTVYALGARALAERKTYFREAEQIARAGIVAGREKIESQRSFYETEGNYEQVLNWMIGMMYDSLGWVYYQEGRLTEAEKELFHAHELDPKNLENLYHIGQLYEAKGEMEKAEAYYIRGLSIQTPGENPSSAALKAVYEKRHGSLDGFEKYLEDIETREREQRKQKILAERISESESAEPFSLRSLDGPIVSLEDLKNKVVVINFWGIWCGWCVLELPDFQKLHEKYRDDPEMVILTINNDSNPDDVPPWMKKKGYDFLVLFDDGYVAADARIRVFPTTWFLDRGGRKAFIKRGWSEKLFEEFSWRIEALRK